MALGSGVVFATTSPPLDLHTGVLLGLVGYAIALAGVAPARFRFGFAYGWLFGANASGLIGASQLNRHLLSRFPAQRLLGAGLAVAACGGLALFAVVSSGSPSLAWITAPLFVYVASLGLVMPNAVAVAMAPFPGQAGSASGLLGAIQFGLAAIAGTAVGWLSDGTALPMAIVIAVCGVTSLTAYIFCFAAGRA